jgi:hypothetical protein
MRDSIVIVERKRSWLQHFFIVFVINKASPELDFGRILSQRHVNVPLTVDLAASEARTSVQYANSATGWDVSILGRRATTSCGKTTITGRRERNRARFEAYGGWSVFDNLLNLHWACGSLVGGVESNNHCRNVKMGSYQFCAKRKK